MEKISDARLVLISTESYENASQIAKILVFERLAACCSIQQNNVSFYEWHGSIEQRLECTLLIKTFEDKLPELEQRVLEIHTDKIPEIIALQVSEISSEYLEWMREVTTGS